MNKALYTSSAYNIFTDTISFNEFLEPGSDMRLLDFHGKYVEQEFDPDHRFRVYPCTVSGGDRIDPYRFVSVDKEPTQIIPSEEDLIWSDAGQFFSNEDSSSQTDEHTAKELFTPTISEPDSDGARKAVEKYFDNLK